MLKHVVLWTMKEQDNEELKLSEMKEIRDAVYKLKKTINEIKGLDIIFNDRRASKDNYDLMLILMCEDFDALQNYANHPDHLKVLKLVKSKVSSRVAIDYFE